MPLGSHRYWRITDIVTPAGSSLGFAECWLYNTPGGSELAVSVATASSNFDGTNVPSHAVDNNSATFWACGAGTVSDVFSSWFQWDLGTAQTPGALQFTSRNDFGGGGAQNPTSCVLQYSDDASTWHAAGLARLGAQFSNGETRTFDLANLVTDLEANQLRVMAAFHLATADINANQLRAMTVFNFPTEFIKANQLVVVPVYREPASIQANQLRVMAVVRGRVDQPSLVAWTFTLDGHDFYALRLGDVTTLIYDQNTQQWAEWGEDLPIGDGITDTNARWTISTGLNWQGLGALAQIMGTDVVAGDDTFGAIYVFDPEEDEDYKAYTGAGQPFTRVAQGQLTMVGRDAVPIWGVQLSGSVGEQWSGDLVNVELQSSDDMGNSYYSHGVVSIVQGNFAYRLDWNSLGAMNNPGRLFKVIDTGALVRLDALDAYDRDGA